MTLRERALNLLARREHSRAELAGKLSPHGGADEVAALLDALEAEGLLSDRRYVEALRHARAGRHGSLRLAQELREKGVGEDLAAQALEAARSEDLAACRAVWQKKFGAPPTDLKQRSRQYRFLLNRGFPAEVVARVIGGAQTD